VAAASCGAGRRIVRVGGGGFSKALRRGVEDTLNHRAGETNTEGRGKGRRARLSKKSGRRWVPTKEAESR